MDYKLQKKIRDFITQYGTKTASILVKENGPEVENLATELEVILEELHKEVPAFPEPPENQWD